MAFELIFTSNPEGLKHGSRGFTTVACTQGMPLNIVKTCESLSGYVHIFSRKDEEYSQNPVAYSHYPFKIGGKDYNILSRVCAYGFDYSGRTNKLAHHIVLERNELNRAGPAWLMSQSGFLSAEWDGKVQFLPQDKIDIPDTEISNWNASRWRSITGHPEWAGVLAQSFLDDPASPAFIVFEPGMDLLPLIAEAQALLPPDMRWQNSFSTYHTALPVGTNCAWRCCLAESKAISKSRRFPNALVIDLIEGTIKGNAPSNTHLQSVAAGGGAPQWNNSELNKNASTTAEDVHGNDNAQRAARPIRSQSAATSDKKIKIDYGDALRPRAPKKEKRIPSFLIVVILIAMLSIICIWLLFRKNQSRNSQMSLPGKETPASEPDIQSDAQTMESDSEGGGSREAVDMQEVEGGNEPQDQSNPVSKNKEDDKSKNDKQKDETKKTDKALKVVAPEESDPPAPAPENKGNVHVKVFDSQDGGFSLDNFNVDNPNKNNPKFYTRSGKVIKIDKYDKLEFSETHLFKKDVRVDGGFSSDTEQPLFEISSNGQVLFKGEKQETGLLVYKSGADRTAYLSNDLSLPMEVNVDPKKPEENTINIKTDRLDKEFAEILGAALSNNEIEIKANKKISLQLKPRSDDGLVLKMTDNEIKHFNSLLAKMQIEKASLNKFNKATDQMTVAINRIVGARTKGKNFADDYISVLQGMESLYSDNKKISEDLDDVINEFIWRLKDEDLWQFNEKKKKQEMKRNEDMAKRLDHSDGKNVIIKLMCSTVRRFFEGPYKQKDEMFTFIKSKVLNLQKPIEHKVSSGKKQKGDAVNRQRDELKPYEFINGGDLQISIELESDDRFTIKKLKIQ